MITGLDGISTQEIVVYSNPSTGKFYVQTPGRGAYRVTVTDIFQRVVYTSKRVESEVAEVDATLAAGIYIVTVTGDAGSKKARVSVVSR